MNAPAGSWPDMSHVQLPAILHTNRVAGEPKRFTGYIFGISRKFLCHSTNRKTESQR